MVDEKTHRDQDDRKGDVGRQGTDAYIPPRPVSEDVSRLQTDDGDPEARAGPVELRKGLRKRRPP
ncbi:hypothetical protein SDC9_106425 [bioreactor metagenome]|uniref:Uncharacterized protein n=1 Tax=bioreactor metagenome TaxID=1076179 RepID=A0A645B4R1_9ZZZZ